MTRTKSRIGASAVVLVGGALVVVACDLGETSSIVSSGGSFGVAGQNGGAGRVGVGGSGGFAGGPVTGGSAGSAGIGGAGAGGAAAGGAGGVGGAANSCTKLPADQLLTDFSPTTFKAADNSTWKASKADLWGSTTSLTGGDVFYQGKAESAPSVTLHGQSLTITASVAAGDYAGYMFNFKPACTNASGTTGLRFDVLSDSTIGNATLKVQMQQKSDYPSTANPNSRPGDCVPSSAATQYNDCLSPATTVVSSGTAIAPGKVELPWTTFSGGVPVSTVDSSQLMAIQWQFECPPDGGAIVSSAGGSGGGGAGGAGGSSAGAAMGGGDTGGLGASGSSAGTSGDSSVSGSGGSSATSGGSASSGASSGGTSGSSGSAGSSVDGGSGGTGGANTAGSGGNGSTTPSPCVVSLTIDNVTFY